MFKRRKAALAEALDNMELAADLAIARFPQPQETDSIDYTIKYAKALRQTALALAVTMLAERSAGRPGRNAVNIAEVLASTTKSAVLFAATLDHVVDIVGPRAIKPNLGVYTEACDQWDRAMTAIAELEEVDA